MISKIRICLSLISSFVLLTACTPPNLQNNIQEIDTYLSQLSRDQTFSGAVLIAQGDEILLSKGYGMADVENRIPNTPDTRFRIHWITMQFTAMAVMMLQAEGKLNVEDHICPFIPDCPEYWDGITIHHLLTHTSGVSDWIQPWDSTAEIPTSALQLVEQIKHKPPYFEPGTDFRYSENGYLILGYVIGKVSEHSYVSFLQQRIFNPLGMKYSGYEDGKIAIGYKSNGQPAPKPDLLFRFSASGLFSSVEDLYLWDQALCADELISREYLDKIFTGYAETPSTDFEGSKYGYGWFIGEILERPVVFHGGMMAGYQAMILRFLEDGVTIIVLRNRETQIYDRLEIKLTEMLFEKK